MTPLLFLFGSVHSLLKSENNAFEKLNQLPFNTYINIGLESIDTPTLSCIGKPVDESMVREAFKKMLDINASHKNIEISVNFVIGKGLSADHYQSLKELLRDAPVASRRKGAIYLSPLKDSPKKSSELNINSIPKLRDLLCLQRGSALGRYKYLYRVFLQTFSQGSENDLTEI